MELSGNFIINDDGWGDRLTSEIISHIGPGHKSRWDAVLYTYMRWMRVRTPRWDAALYVLRYGCERIGGVQGTKGR